ncbi:MAG: GTPase HflX [Bacteroidetes bacterium]|nr:GTPase HflX [Bacteroidota bacterium]NBX63544.1 GTPase HflX [Bacteroidota bacterium]
MATTQLHSTANHTETAIVVGVNTPQQAIPIEESLSELEQLVLTSGAESKKRFIQNLEHPQPKTYVGKGKLEEIKQYVIKHKIDLVIFDDELTPAQVRNIETEMENAKILSRTHLILDIFANNAKTAQAKTQVELAQSIFMLPRLTGMWTHLSKQKGGIGMKGPGEKEIETDRRVLRDKIALLKTKLQDIEKIGFTQRKSRDGVFRCALVGYTNVGKSTVMNLLSRSDVLVENKLFATLDATVRKVVIPHPDNQGGMIPLLLSDTVGFIRKLPTLLIESFKSTLAEAMETDLLIHVVDISNPAFEQQMMSVKEILHEIGASNKPELIVFNKIDAFKEPEEDDFFVGSTGLTLEQFEKSWIAKENAPAVFISAQNNTNIEKLRTTIVEMLQQQKRANLR